MLGIKENEKIIISYFFLENVATSYYIIVRGKKILQQKKQDEEDSTKKHKRKKPIRKPWPAGINFNKCPECKQKVIHDEEHALDYCTKCGLITRASLEYIGLEKAKYPYHIILW